MQVTSFRPYRDPPPETIAEYANFEPTVEHLLGIQELWDECEAVKAQVARARVISETDTVNERTDWESPLMGALVRLCEEVAHA